MIDERTFQVIRGTAFALVVGLSLWLERLRPQARTPVRRRDNVYLWGINAVVLGVICGACICTAARWAAEARVGLCNVLDVPMWAALPGTIVFLDLLSYAWHWANHHVPALWRFHRVHHLDQAPNFTTALRFHPGELLLSLPIRLATVVALGVPVPAVIAFEIVFTWSNVLEHGTFDVGSQPERVAARLLITPAMHRLHHSSERDDLDTNFGTIFAVWDRLFRTYRPSTSGIHFVAGVPGRITGVPPTLLGLLAEPLRRATP